MPHLREVKASNKELVNSFCNGVRNPYFIYKVHGDMNRTFEKMRFKIPKNSLDAYIDEITLKERAKPAKRNTSMGLTFNTSNKAG